MRDRSGFLSWIWVDPATPCFAKPQYPIWAAHANRLGFILNTVATPQAPDLDHPAAHVHGG